MTPTPDTTARTETAETVHNYRVGDPVRIVRNRNTGTAHDHCFQIGTVRHIRALHDDGSGVDLGEWSCGFDEIEPAETAETVTVPRGPLPEGVVTAVVCDYLKMAERDPILREIGPVSLRALWSVLATHFAAAPALSPQHPVGVREALERGEEERDALLKALGFKPGPFEDDLSRRVILEDAAGLRPAMVKAREAESRAEFAAASAVLELDEIRAELLAGQGDDDGPQILPDFEEGQSVLQMVCKCIALLETRRDITEATISHPPAQDAPGAVKVKALNDDDFPKEIYVQHPSDADFDGQRWSLHDDFDGQHKAVRYVRADLDPSPPLPEADGEVVARLTALAKDLAAINTLPKPGDLYYAVKNEGEGTGWSYRCSGVLASDIATAASALVSTLRERDEIMADAVKASDERAMFADWYREEKAAREKAEQALEGIRAVAAASTKHRGNIGKEVEFLTVILDRANAALAGEARLHPDHVRAEVARDEARAEARQVHAAAQVDAERLAEEVAAREKAEQVAAGLRERILSPDFIKEVAQEYLSHRGERPWRILRGGQELWEAHTDAIKSGLVSALRASTEEGKTATPSVIEGEATPKVEPVAWQPWGDAPKDGSEVLAYRPDMGVFIAYFVEEDAHLSTPEHPPEGDAYWFSTNGDDLTDDLPTYWAQKPAGPTATPSVTDEKAGR